jgi:hypothetical protein
MVALLSAFACVALIIKKKPTGINGRCVQGICRQANR